MKTVPITDHARGVEFGELKVCEVVGANAIFPTQITQEIGGSYGHFNVSGIAQIGFLCKEVKSLPVQIEYANT